MVKISQVRLSFFVFPSGRTTGDRYVVRPLFAWTLRLPFGGRELGSPARSKLVLRYRPKTRVFKFVGVGMKSCIRLPARWRVIRWPLFYVVRSLLCLPWKRRCWWRGRVNLLLMQSCIHTCKDILPKLFAVRELSTQRSNWTTHHSTPELFLIHPISPIYHISNLLPPLFPLQFDNPSIRNSQLLLPKSRPPCTRTTCSPLQISVYPKSVAHICSRFRRRRSCHISHLTIRNSLLNVFCSSPNSVSSLK